MRRIFFLTLIYIGLSSCKSSVEYSGTGSQYLSTPLIVRTIDNMGSHKPEGKWGWFERSNSGYNMILTHVFDNKVRIEKTRVAIYGKEAFIGREIFFGLFDEKQGAYVTNRNNCLPHQKNLLVLKYVEGDVALHGAVGKHLVSNISEILLQRQRENIPKDFSKIISLVERNLKDRTNGCFESSFIKFRGEIDIVTIY